MQRKALPLLVAFFLFVGLGFWYRENAKPALRVFEVSGETMGTYYDLKFVADFSLQQDQFVLLKQEVDLELMRINQLMSTYIDDSELSKFNQSKKVGEWIDVSAATAFVVSEGLKIGQLTEGAYDLSIGTLVNLWGFGPAAQPRKIPTQAEVGFWLKQPKPAVEVVLSPAPAMKKLSSDVYVDLSGIAKGYAVDMLSAVLSNRGFKNHLVDIGGEMTVRGSRLGSKWQIGIEKAQFNQSRPVVQKIIDAEDFAVATSGTYRNYYERDGRRFSHVLDPKTGFPIQHKVVSLTVLDPTAMHADALATGLFVVGVDRVKELSEKNLLAVYLQAFSEDGQLIEWESSEFVRLTSGIVDHTVGPKS